MHSRPEAFALASTTSSPMSAAPSSSSLWENYPLAQSRRPVPPFGRRPSMLASQVVSLPEEELVFEMTEDPSEMDSEMSTRPLSGRTSVSRHSRSSSQGSSTFNLVRHPSSPSAEDRTFNPLNPQSLQAPRRQRESSGESAGMQADSPLLGARSPTPPLVNTGSATLSRAKSSPSLLTTPIFASFAPPTTPPPTERKRFASVDIPEASPGAVQGVLSTSPSSRPGPAKRAVTGKRANLVPKSKAHLRVQLQLQDEGTTPFETEVASEAALHRLARSAASALSPRGMPTPNAGSLGNRFPESTDGDDDPRQRQPISSDSDDDGVNSDLASRADDVGSVTDEPLGIMGDIEQEERRRQIQLWTGFRERPIGQSPTALTSGRGMELDTFSPTGSSGWGASVRPNKRKMAESDRFEPYSSMAFKRRAVSPTASVQGSSTPALGSPILGAFSSATIATPIQIPPLSPGSTGLGLYPRGPGSSRASSPAASVTGPLSSSLPTGSSSGRGPLGLGFKSQEAILANNARDDEELSARAGDTLMSLG